MRTRGFTLLEIMIALGVLAVVLGLSLPALSARLDRGSFDAGVDRVRHSIELAREEAREIGVPVQVRARTELSGGVVLEWRTADSPGASEESGATPDEAAWTRVAELGRGLTITRERPASSPGAPEVGAGPDELESFAEREAGDELPTQRIGLFLPSGEAIVPGPSYLVEAGASPVSSDQRWVELSISPWTGRVTIERPQPTDPSEAFGAEDNDELSGGLLAPSGVAP